MTVLRIVLLIILLSLCAHADNRSIVLTPIPDDQPDKHVIWARSSTTPLFEFRVEAGRVPKGAPISGCKQLRQVTTYAGHFDNALILECENGIVLHLIDVDFGR